jgi:glycosyltransferase involved in cell wall biosynthesis
MFISPTQVPHRRVSCAARDVDVARAGALTPGLGNTTGCSVTAETSYPGATTVPERTVRKRQSVTLRSPQWTALHIVETWPGGVGNHLEWLIGQQLEDPRIALVHLACSAERTPERLGFEQHPRLQVHRYTSSRKPWRFARACRELQAIISKTQPSIVHLHSTFAGLYGRLVSAGCPRVYCAHGWAFTQDVGPARRLAYALVEACLARRTDALIHISHDEFRAAWRHGVRAPLNRVVLHGVRPANYAEPADLRVDPGKINLGFVGRFDRQKGVDVLLRAFGSLRRDDLHLYMVGDFDRERRAGTVPGDSSAISWLGWIPQARIDSYLRQFDAVVVPSRWEGFGLVAAEAMRNGKPVIVSDRGGLPEQVVHGFNGLVFPFEDASALRAVLDSLTKEELRVMGGHALSVWTRSFSEARAYRELMDVYSGLLAQAEAAC